MNKLARLLFCLALIVGIGGGAYASSLIAFGNSASWTSPSISGDDTTGFYTSGAGKIDASTGGTQRIDISSTGLYVANNLLVGSTSVQTTAGSGAPAFELNGVSTASSANLRWSVGSSGAIMILGQSAGGTIGTHGVIATTNNEGQIQWQGDDGTAFQTSAAIICQANGTISSGVVPGQCVWQTANSSGTLTTALTINNAQQATFAGTVKTGGYTVSTLPTGTVGMRAYVTDQATSCPAVGAALTGSGAVTCPVFYNGSAWVSG